MSGQLSSTFEIGSQKYAIDRYADDSSSVKRPVVVVHGVDGMAGESCTEIRRFADQIAGQEFLVFTPHDFDANDGSDTLSTLGSSPSGNRCHSTTPLWYEPTRNPTGR